MSNVLNRDGFFGAGRRAAVSMTYDDALNVHLDIAMPELEKRGFRGTFYTPTHGEPHFSWFKRTADWRAAADRGHEIGNHTQHHPCSNKHAWVKPNFSLESYTLGRMETELTGAQAEIDAAVGKHLRTFAYTCCEDFVGPEKTSFRPLVNRLFPAARGGAGPTLADPYEVDLNYTPAWSLTEKGGAAEVIAFLDRAIDEGKWAILIMHGVGGDHGLNVSQEFHAELCAAIEKRKSALWCDTFLNVAQHIRAKTKQPWNAR